MTMTYGFSNFDLKLTLGRLGQFYVDEPVDPNIIPALSDYTMSDYIEFIYHFPTWMKYFITLVLYNDSYVDFEK